MPGELQPGTPRQRSTPAAGSARTWPIRGVDGHRRVRGLVRIHPDHYHRHDWHLLPLPGGQDRGGHAQFQESQRRSRPSFEPCHGEAPARWHVVRSQAQQEPAADMRTGPTGTSQRYEPGSLPSRPGPQRLPTIGRLSRGTPSTVRHCRGRTRYPFTRLSKLFVPGTSLRKPGSCPWTCQ